MHHDDEHAQRLRERLIIISEDRLTNGDSQNLLDDRVRDADGEADAEGNGA